MVLILACMTLSIVGYGIYLDVKREISIVLDFVYFLSYLKLAVTTIKYIPQAWSNYQRKSTSGWSIYTCLLDITGGVLSIVQLLFDGWRSDDWTGVQNNKLKFGLGFVSILFDVIFIVQHYVLYGHKASYIQIDEESGDERKSVISNGKYMDYSKGYADESSRRSSVYDPQTIQ